MKKLPIILGALAGITLIPAWILPAMPHRAQQVAAIDRPVFGAKTVPEQIATLRVAEWDDTTSAAKLLEVKRSGANNWVIPSHYDYPADANDRVTRATVGFLGVEHGRLVTEDQKRFEELGLIDPLDPDLTKKKGRGKRLTMTDVTGKVIADLIVGNRATSGDGVYFMREATSNQVYTAKVNPSNLSTKFIDYVEADPLKIKAEDIRALTIADYSVNEQQQRIDMRAETKVSRSGAIAEWVTPTPPADKRVAQSAIGAIVSGLTSMKLAGVRPFDAQWLQPRGFFLLPTGTVDRSSPEVGTSQGQRAVIGNEGRLDITSKDGLRYSLIFGEVALDDDTDTAADSRKKDDKPTDAVKDGEPKQGETKPEDKPAGHSRYMVLFVSYDEAADEDAKMPPEIRKNEEAKSPEKKKLSGKERAQKAQERFLKYFYVISDDSFKSLRPSLDKLFEAKPPEPMAGSTGKTNVQWLEENGKRSEVKTTASGLQYQVLSSGKEDAPKPASSNRVLVTYVGTLVDGAQFDASQNGPTEFGVGEVIKGWTEALTLMREGDHWKLYIKPELGYGEAGQVPKIPQNAILIFDVELVKVKPVEK
ncbi:MAG: DUF4340 domain-containing protein [Planctomycetes bacterium]|nr:DUF4340 domain-containing protein [Planctomycetota bacterium]